MGRSLGIRLLLEIPELIHQLRFFEKVGAADSAHALPPSSDCFECSC